MRSLLAVPATNPRFIAKAAQSAADAVFIDLEDAVLPERKLEARRDAIAAINGIDWGGRILAVRVNDLSTPWGVRDIVEVVEACPRLDRVILPKCETPGDVHAVGAMLRAAELAGGRERPVRIDALVETARGVANVEAIAAAGSEGRGAMKTADGKMIDLVHIRIARKVLERAERNATRR